jgi:DNA cross-link repair 1C protein
MIQILLRLEKYPHRMNFSKGILETHVQTYKHLKTLLKTIPLETPTIIELSPGNEIRITLFDANHCTGAVMFLIQGRGKAILYTGDIRSEVWWINSLVKSPVLLPYTLDNQRLDNIYLDTTFATKSEPYLEFPSKADGLRELVEKVEKYPKDTMFYIETWTFGYENVWIALSAFLQSQIHLDRYRWGVYKSLNHKKKLPECIEAPPLLGFQLGNHESQGCLTSDSNVQIHSCERGSGCPIMEQNPNMVRIVPIITRLPNGVEMHEMGIGGGKGDLDQKHELRIDDASALGALMQLCATQIPNQEELLEVYSLLTTAFRPDRSPECLNLEEDLDNVRLDQLVNVLKRIFTEKAHAEPQIADPADANQTNPTLPATITFPYSRHSSYSELCSLVSAFRPRDVYPCTVDNTAWSPENSMRSLFGHLCSGNIFSHDIEMLEMFESRTINKQKDVIASQGESQSQAMTSGYSQDSGTGMEQDELVTQIRGPQDMTETVEPVTQIEDQKNVPRYVPGEDPSQHEDEFFTPDPIFAGSSIPPVQAEETSTRPFKRNLPDIALPESTPQSYRSTISPPKRKRTGNERSIRAWAYRAAAGLDENCNTWDAFGGLSCVKGAGEEDIELGEDE